METYSQNIRYNGTVEGPGQLPGISFDTDRLHIVLGTAKTSYSAAEIWTAWVDWHPSHPQWPLAMAQKGGDAIGGGLFSPLYFFMLNGWRVRPMEADHDLDITGNLAVEGGGRPVVRTLGAYQVNTFLIVPERAQGIATSGSTGPSAADIAAAILSAAQITPIYSDIRKVLGGQVVGAGTEANPWGPA